MLSYIGGKSKIGKWIVPFYDKDMETYVETFGGMFWCFFNMDLKQYPNLKRVVYNDFNPLNYNLFKCVQNPTELLKSINSIDCQKQGVDITPSIYKEQFVKFQADLFSENVKLQAYDYDMAAKYVYILTQVFSGSKPETSNFIDLKGKYKSKYLTFRDKLSKDYDAPNKLKEMVKSNKLGKKTGHGVYKWPENGRPKIDMSNPADFDLTELLKIQINEGVKVFAEGLATPKDIDNAMKLGYSLPIGPIEALEGMDLKELTSWLDSIADKYGKEIYRAHDWLRDGSILNKIK